jgi:oligopeptide/dipeptide ABC transporter ATP-binding protein
VTALLEIDRLSVDFSARDGATQVLDSVDLAIAPGETVCLLGESGSGKTVTAMSVMRLIDFKDGRITGGAIGFGGRDLTSLTQRQMSALRGRKIGLVFQEPMTAFDPLFSVGAQIVEVLTRHRGLRGDAARKQAIALLGRVKITDPERCIDQYPHQLSGGMRQRAMIAMALACEPTLLIADEPTTALDVTIQAQILQLLRDVQAQTGMAMLLITHDLGVAASIADRVVVMYAGRIVEDAPVRELFARPAHPYTRGLLRSSIGRSAPSGDALYSIEGSIPDLSRPPAGCRFHPRCPHATGQCTIVAPPLRPSGQGVVACWHPQDGAERVAVVRDTAAPEPAAARPAPAPLVRAVDVAKHYPAGSSWVGERRKVVRAVDGVTFDIREGETFGLVGESGSGKSTLARLLLALERPSSGRVEFHSEDLAGLDPRAMRAQRRHMQMIFQDPHGSIDPRWSIGKTIAEPLAVHDALPPAERRERVRALLDQVGLDPDWERRFPHQLSGGQRQRVAIARAIALNPRLIVADEAVSALDVSVRAQVVNLLVDLKARLGLTYLFIGHELNLIRHVSDRIGVMYLGRMVEVGPAEAVFHRPAHPYTRALIAAIPEPDPSRRDALRGIDGEIPSPTAVSHGCHFQSRCAGATALCREREPELSLVGPGRTAACHYPT